MVAIAAPIVEPTEGSILLSEHFASAEQGDLTIDLYRTPYLIEAEVRRTFADGGPSKLVLNERLNIRPSLDSWLKDLLDRAQKETS